jgi:plasmid stabilization system protein ParE
LKLVWQSEARRELREALAYYRDRAGLDVAQDFRLAAMRAAERLLDHPDIGAMTRHGARRCVLHDYPYTLFYRVTPESLIILAVAHQSRRPGYWAGRR